ncbi:hypothetical protein M3212_20570 [Alkalihalobacillus oceani]|uniref:hypothetical protein n=1 Tax=Halalkalibacter oceani TaxID=1653776 RepID=UPI00203FF443|nr:hypothetical protein [Halalkalibacter oceani]MCM3763118.1 hypothetical protein [Halalkalibacter oceani]
MKRKRISLLMAITIGALLLALVGILSITLTSEQEDRTIPSTEPKELTFGDNYISYVLDEESTLTINLFGAQDVSTDGPSYFDSVGFISLENENIEIVDYEISQGDILDDQQLFNILLEVKLHSNEVEKANELTIHYNQVEEASFVFGTLILKDDNGFNQEDLDVTGDRNIVAAPLPLFEANVMNQASDPIELSKVYDLADNLVFTFKEKTEIAEGETGELAVSNFDEVTHHDFYTITPIVEYKRNNEVHQYYMPGVVFGVTIDAADKMDRILN